MNPQLNENTQISLPKGTFLVLFEYVARSYGLWRGGGTSPDEATFWLEKPDEGERLALWQLERAIERTLPEVFAPDYKQLLETWKQELISNRR